MSSPYLRRPIRPLAEVLAERQETARAVGQGGRATIVLRPGSAPIFTIET